MYFMSDEEMHEAQPELEFDNNEPLDLEPLQFEMPGEEMHEAQGEAEDEDSTPEFRNPFEGQLYP
jgi:hypothetical protein